VFLAGALLGGGAGGYVASRSGGATPSATAPLAGSPVADNDPVPSLVARSLPSVVTVVNKLADGSPQATGTGYVIDGKNGYIATNNHVVANVNGSGAGAAFDVIFNDSRTTAASLVGRDPFTDVAVLRVSTSGLTALVLGDNTQVPVGSRVVAIGSALGRFENTVTTGVVSAKGRRVPESQDIVLDDLVQTDAAINEGNSGGPLLWVAAGQVIGMNTLISAIGQGLGFAVSSNTVRAITDELIKNGKIERGYLGITYALVTPRAAQALGLPSQATGALVESVAPGSPAAQAGIQPGDLITKVNDIVVDPDHPLASVLARSKPGDKIALTVIRGGQSRTVTAALGTAPPPG
jgi:S1-C subfamily serine protease